jgi:hypothetical protein
MLAQWLSARTLITQPAWDHTDAPAHQPHGQGFGVTGARDQLQGYLSSQTSSIRAPLAMLSWLVGGVVPGIERQPRKKLEPSPGRLLAVLHR